MMPGFMFPSSDRFKVLKIETPTEADSLPAKYVICPKQRNTRILNFLM